MKTPHSVECRRVCETYDGDCFRCRELWFGAPPRDRRGKARLRTDVGITVNRAMRVLLPAEES